MTWRTLNVSYYTSSIRTVHGDLPWHDDIRAIMVFVRGPNDLKGFYDMMTVCGDARGCHAFGMTDRCLDTLHIIRRRTNHLLVPPRHDFHNFVSPTEYSVT